MAAARVVFDDAAIKLSIEDEHSEVGRAMGRLADSAVLTMKLLCPVSPRDQAGPAPGHPRQVARRSGTLRSSIRKFRQPDGSYLVGPTDEIGPGQLLGPLIEKGTRPHVIRSQGPWPLYSTTTRQRYGRPVYTGPPGRQRLLYWEVHHPGTRAQPFIRRTAEALNGTTIRT